MVIRRSVRARGVSGVVFGTVCAGLLMSALRARCERGDCYEFEWFNVSSNGSTDAMGGADFDVIAFLNPPDNAGSRYLFDLTPTALAAAGETALGDVDSLTFSFAGQTLTKADITSITSGWTDENFGPAGDLQSSWSASNTFAALPAGTLSLGNNPEGSFAEFGSQTATGFWLIDPSPVPLPGAAWLLLSGVGILGLFAKGRLHGTSAAPSA